MTLIKRVITADAGPDDIIFACERMKDKPSFLKKFVAQLKNRGDYESLGLDDDVSDEELVETARDFIDNQFQIFEDAFYEAAKFQGNGIIAWRGMKVKEAKAFAEKIRSGKFEDGFTGLGEFFAWDEHKAIEYWGETMGNKGGESVTIKALVPIKSVNIEKTTMANVDESTGDECELNVKVGAKIQVLDILDKDDKSLLGDNKKPLKSVAKGLR